MTEMRSDEFALCCPGLRSLVILALCGLLAAPAQALSQSAEESSACENASSTAAMRECEIARLKRADAGMNAVYQRLSAKLDQRGREKLRAAQEAWLKFRDAEANFQADAVRDGTLAPLIAASVQADLTQARHAELEKAVREYK
ncbi:MAG: lysozyme inhibitor LprI family protein [Gammaproteobacteria bacterium]